MRRSALALSVVLIVACAHRMSFNAYTQLFYGDSVQRLIMEFGPPTSEYHMDNSTTYYSWVRVSGQQTVDAYNRISTWSCKTTFTVKDGKVQDIVNSGNWCRYLKAP